MWNQLVQGIAIGAALLFLYGGIDKKHKGRRAPYFLCSFLALLLCGSFSFLRVENFFYTFPSVRAAVDYSGSGTLCGLVEGTSSAMAVFLTEGQVQTSTFPKTEKGCKLGTLLDTQLVVNVTDPPAATRIVRCRDDYYVLVVSTFTTDRVTAADSLGTNFSTYTLADDSGLTYHLFFSPLTQDPTPLAGDYRITLTPAEGDPFLFTPLA